MTKTSMRPIGSHPAAVWAIKHVVSPLDRIVVKLSRGRVPQPSSLVLPSLLLTTVGRQTGLDRTIPLVYVRDGDRYLIANARPSGERSNPWVANLRAAGVARIKIGRRTMRVTARELDEAEADTWWPALNEVWPAFDEHYVATGERAVFAIRPIDTGDTSGLID